MGSANTEGGHTQVVRETVSTNLERHGNTDLKNRERSIAPSVVFIDCASVSPHVRFHICYCLFTLLISLYGYLSINVYLYIDIDIKWPLLIDIHDIYLI